MSGQNVLVCKKFYYFGIENAIDVENKDFTIPRWKKFSIEDKEANYVSKNYSEGLYPNKKWKSY